MRYSKRHFLYAACISLLFSCAKTPTRNAIPEQSTSIVALDIRQFLQSLSADADILSLFSAEKEFAKVNINNPGIDVWGEAYLFTVSDLGCSETIFISLPISDAEAFKKLLDDKISSLKWSKDNDWIASNVQWQIHLHDKFALLAYSYGKKSVEAINATLAAGVAQILSKQRVKLHQSIEDRLNKPFISFVWIKREALNGFYEDIIANIPFDHAVLVPQFQKGGIQAEMALFADDEALSAIHEFILSPISDSEFFNYHLSPGDAISVAMHFNIQALKKALKRYTWFERFTAGVMLMGHDTSAMMQMLSGNVVCSVKEANHQGGLIPQFVLHVGLADSGYGISFLNDLEFLGALKRTGKQIYEIPSLPGYELEASSESLSLKFLEQGAAEQEIALSTSPLQYQNQLMMIEINSKKLAQTLKGASIAQQNLPWAEYMPGATVLVPEQHNKKQLIVNIQVETAIKEENAFFTLMRMLDHSQLRQLSKN